MNRNRASTIDILENQAQLLKQINLDLSASTFTAHHVENAFKETQKQLHAIHSLRAQKIAFKAQVDSLTIDCQQLDVAADHQKKLVGQSIKDTAVFAENIQLAGNAITRLAGDAGSILSVIQAADNHTQIYQLAQEVSVCTNETANLAATIAQQALVASAHSSEIIAGALADNAEPISLLLHNLANHIPIGISLIQDTEQALVAAGADMHAVKSILENNRTQYKAIERAYAFMNLQLNMNLHVTTHQETNSFTVSFNDYQHPFKAKAPITTHPVSAYCILLLKEKSKDTFSLEQAEQLLQNKNQFIEIQSQDSTKKKIIKDIKTTEILDTDQESFQPNEIYVVCVLTVFTDDFKKSIHSFDNDLSAPSAPFVFHSKEIAERSTPIEEIYALTRQVEEAEQEVKFKQLIVDTQQASSIKNQQFLVSATQIKENELSNKNQIDLLASHAFELKKNSEKALHTISETLVSAQKVAEDIHNLLDKLIFSAEMIHKLQNMLVRQKALNPLISDDLLSMIAAAASDSNNAVDLTLAALKSTFTGVSSCMKADAALQVECKQSLLVSNQMKEGKEAAESIIAIAQSIYRKVIMDDQEQTEQASLANSDLNEATVKLRSLQAGLSAAKAAAGLLI